MKTPIRRYAVGPFRLLKYFIISGFLVIAVVTFLLGAFLYTSMVDTLRQGATNYGHLLAENLNYNIYNGFYGPLKAKKIAMDLKQWDQFGALDSLIKDISYGLKIQCIKIMDQDARISYSTDYDLIGRYEPSASPVQDAMAGKPVTLLRQEKDLPYWWSGKWLADTYYPLREGTGHYWMLGNIYGVIQISQDVSDQYRLVQRSVMAIILVAAGMMAFLFVMLTLIVRRGEQILVERAGQQKRLEEQLQQSEKLASLGQMVATIAHEIRNPLGIIRSSAEMLVKKANPDPARITKLSGVIVEEASRLSIILTDFLDFARPRVPRTQAIDVRNVIARVRNNLDQAIQERNITWVENTLNGGYSMVSGDADLLYQAFLNVAMNAFEALDQDGTLSVTVEPEQTMVRIGFTDSGPGIKEENLGKIFTPFFTTHQMGTGLGLSVVHNIVTAHGGELSVESSEGQGATFNVFLPKAELSEQTENV